MICPDISLPPHNICPPLDPQVQDLKGAIRVYCRIRPPGRTGDPSSPCTEVGEEGELAIHDPSGQQDCKIFRFDKIFDGNSSQSDVYEDTQPLIRSVLDGEWGGHGDRHKRVRTCPIGIWRGSVGLGGVRPGYTYSANNVLSV